MKFEVVDNTCPACGANLPGGLTCEDCFHQMLFWENEEPLLGEVHHLMVLCYHLQHPHLYSQEGLANAAGLLIDFVERGLDPAEVRSRSRERVASDKRLWSVSARPGNRGSYAGRPAWTFTVADVVAGGPSHYIRNVRFWARSTLTALKAAGLPARLESRPGS